MSLRFGVTEEIGIFGKFTETVVQDTLTCGAKVNTVYPHLMEGFPVDCLMVSYWPILTPDQEVVVPEPLLAITYN